MAKQGRESSKGSRPLLAQVKTSVEGELQLYTSITMNSNKYWSFSISLCSSGYQNILGSFYTIIIAIIIVVAFLLWDGERKIPLFGTSVLQFPYSLALIKLEVSRYVTSWNLLHLAASDLCSQFWFASMKRFSFIAPSSPDGWNCCSI